MTDHPFGQHCRHRRVTYNERKSAFYCHECHSWVISTDGTITTRPAAVSGLSGEYQLIEELTEAWAAVTGERDAAMEAAFHERDHTSVAEAERDAARAEVETLRTRAERAEEVLRGLLAHPGATVWSCSVRCWQEDGPHDDTCHPIEPKAWQEARAFLAEATPQPEEAPS